jgi:hypothetical protein
MARRLPALRWLVLRVPLLVAWPTAALLVAWPAATLLVAAPAAAQTVGEFALLWTLGDYRAPLICDVDGAPERVLRRVSVTPVRRQTHRLTNRIVFHDLEAPERTRCYDDRGRDEPNVLGALSIVHEGRRDRPDLGQHEFQETLRREGAFSFKIASGSLRLGEPGAPLESLRSVSFAGGTAVVSAVRVGTDVYRRLAEFGPVPKRRLELEAPDGTQLAVDLVQIER